MSEYDAGLPTERLLTVTLATHDAFTRAARVAAGQGHAAEFARRAEYQERIATHLRGHQSREGLESDALRHVPEVWSEWSARRVTGGGDTRALFDNCLRLMDAATLEFCRAYGPNVALILSGAMQSANPIHTTRHGNGADPAGKESTWDASSDDVEPEPTHSVRVLWVAAVGSGG